MRLPTQFRIRLFPILLVLMATVLAVGACSNDSSTKQKTPTPGPAQTSVVPTPAPKKMIFMAGFQAQADLPFVAAYVAAKKGYFAQENLDVDIKHATSGEQLKLLLAGDIQVTTADAGSVLKRRSDPDVPIRAITLFGQRGQNAYMVTQKSGIQTPKDWEGKTFGYKTSVPPEYLAILKVNNVDRSKIKEVAVGFDPRILSEGQVDILAVFNSNEPDTLTRLGVPVKVFDPVDYGVPTIGLTYIVTTDQIEKEPELLQRFVNATLKGLAFASDPKNEEETLNIIMSYAAANADREHQRFMLRKELQDSTSSVTQATGLGSMSDAQWKGLYDLLIQYQALPKPFDYKTAFDTRFVAAAQKK